MRPRLDYRRNPMFQAFLPAMEAAHRMIVESSLDATVQELVRIRVSQINGCSFCVGLHTRDAMAAGEDPQRLHLLAAWREAPLYTDAERAALELAETATRIADGGHVGDDIWERAGAHYDEQQLAALAALIAAMNAFNRINAMVRQPAFRWASARPEQLNRD
ncbi:carboxymuconolactone decarboxylase family protein [Nocardia asiatica]|uniref:carboxymuconolactone decarboxylase family protein n=1 Tax=Nocardia asiatica TaxID=209252 RepID=UPI003EDECA79